MALIFLLGEFCGIITLIVVSCIVCAFDTDEKEGKEDDNDKRYNNDDI